MLLYMIATDDHTTVLPSIVPPGTYHSWVTYKSFPVMSLNEI